MTKIAGSGSGSISQRHGSADPDPDPDPHPNVLDLQHCFKVWPFGSAIVWLPGYGSALKPMRIHNMPIYNRNRNSRDWLQPTPTVNGVQGTQILKKSIFRNRNKREPNYLSRVNFVRKKQENLTWNSFLSNSDSLAMSGFSRLILHSKFRN
jgi:hypothetical protein